MDNPLRTIRSLVADNADRVRDTARDVVNRRLDAFGIDIGSDDGEVEADNGEVGADNGESGTDVDSDASVAFGRDVESSESSFDAEEATEQVEPESSPTDSGDEQDATDDEQQVSDQPTASDEETPPSSDRRDSGQNSDHPVGVMFDRQPRSIRRLRPLSGAEDDGGRRRETRRAFVTAGEWRGDARSNGRSDVTLDVSRLELDELHLDVEDLDAQVALQAKIAQLVDVNVGASVELGEVELDVKGVDAEARLEVNLEEIRRILGRALETLEERPELITQAFEAVEETTQEVGDAAEEATRELGDTAGEAVDEVDSMSDDGGIAPSIEAESRTEYDESNRS